MTSYLFTFTVYTTAMIGVIFLALFAYKKCVPGAQRKSVSNFLEVEDSVSLGVRKQLYVVRAGEEKFLIASDAERTTFLSKLNDSSENRLHEKCREITDMNFNVQNLYTGRATRKDAAEVLRNIVSTGDRRNG